jgi:hypothetical protein
MSGHRTNRASRYISDLNRLGIQQGQIRSLFSKFSPFFVALFFLVLVGAYGGLSLQVANENLIMLVAASIIGGYTALNIGANDVANN